MTPDVEQRRTTTKRASKSPVKRAVKDASAQVAAAAVETLTAVAAAAASSSALSGERANPSPKATQATNSKRPAPAQPQSDVAHRTLALHAELLAATSLQVASKCLVGALAAEFGLARASFGLCVAGRTELLAMSDADMGQVPPETMRLREDAFDEAVEQGVVLVWPPADSGAVAGSTAAHGDWIMLAQQALQGAAGGAIATLPLGDNGEVFAAVVLERASGAPFSDDDVQSAQDLLLLAAPALRWMQRAHESSYRRAARELGAHWTALRQPERRLARRALIAGALLLLFVALAPLETSIGGRARIEGAEQRVLVAPTDGFVQTAHVRPGDRVKAGAALVDLVDADLRLEHERLKNQLAQHENAYAAAMVKSDRVAAATSMARVGEAQVQLALVDQQLLRGRVTAPFDALVIQGDLSQSIGAPVRQGDALVTLANDSNYRVIVEIDEVDIAQSAPGQRGQLAVSSLPWNRQDLVVERISPISKAVEGRNVFEVQARLVDPPPDLRPGLLGRAQLVAGRMPPLWAWTRHATDRIRVAYWAWIG